MFKDRRASSFFCRRTNIDMDDVFWPFCVSMKEVFESLFFLDRKKNFNIDNDLRGQHKVKY